MGTQVEFIPRAKWACLKKVSAMPGTLIVYDDGGLGDMSEFSRISQINGHLIFKAGAGSSLKNVDGFPNLRVSC